MRPTEQEITAVEKVGSHSSQGEGLCHSGRGGRGKGGEYEKRLLRFPQEGIDEAK
jgi:hypothetical protein